MLFLIFQHKRFHLRCELHKFDVFGRSRLAASCALLWATLGLWTSRMNESGFCAEFLGASGCFLHPPRVSCLSGPLFPFWQAVQEQSWRTR